MSSEDKKDRSHLPIPTPERTGLITYDAKDPDTKFPPIEQVRPPRGGPNVLLILIDDAGFTTRDRAVVAPACVKLTHGFPKR